MDLNDAPASPQLTDHRRAIEILAREANRPPEDIQEIYRLERANLERSARVKTFIPVLVHRRVRNILHSQDNGLLQPPR
jgi:hypothetical protein